MIINDDMYRNLSELFYEFDNSKASDISKIRKKLKFFYESLVEQTFSHIYNMQFRNLITTLRNINSAQIQINPMYYNLIQMLRESLMAPYPLSSKIYTDDNDNIIDFVVLYMIPFIIEIIKIDPAKNAEKNAFLNFLLTFEDTWGKNE